MPDSDDLADLRKRTRPKITPADSVAADFLRRLRPGGPWLLTAIHPDQPGPITITAHDEAEIRAFVCEHHGRRNLYFSVNPTKRDMAKKASKADIAKVEFLHADLDPRNDETPIRYSAFIDPSGGSIDSMTLAVAHRQDAVVMVDAVREVRPPFSPESVVGEFAAVLKSYRITRIEGDRFAGEWAREPFRAHGVAYDACAKLKSDLYRDLLPLINSRRVELLDNPRMVGQLCALERRTARSGRDSIDHAPGAHDDVINAVAGAVTTAAKPPARLRAFVAGGDGTGAIIEVHPRTLRPIESEPTRIRWVRVSEADAPAARGPY